MKTITEFSGFTLKEAIAKKAALITEGKTEEEAQAAINEQLKLDDTKITFYKNAVDMTSSRVAQVKRVVVAVKSSETEVVPEAFSEREGNFYLVEFFPQAGTATRSRDDDRDTRGSRGNSRGGPGGGRGGNERGRGGNDRGRGNGDRPQGDRAFGGGDRPRGERPAPAPRAPGGSTSSVIVVNPPNPDFKPSHPKVERAPKKPRGPRPEGAAPRGPRPPRTQQGPKGLTELRLVLKGQSQSTMQGSGTVDSAVGAVENTASSESISS